MRYPVDQKFVITSQFGSTSGRPVPHTGTDYVSDNKIVYAVEGGRAVSGVNAQAGNFINITVGNKRWLYGHLRDKTGFNGNVSEGTRLGIMGATGNVTGVHLHLSLFIDGKLVDPNAYIKSKETQVQPITPNELNDLTGALWGVNPADPNHHKNWDGKPFYEAYMATYKDPRTLEYAKKVYTALNGGDKYKPAPQLFVEDK